MISQPMIHAYSVIARRVYEDGRPVTFGRDEWWSVGQIVREHLYGDEASDKFEFPIDQPETIRGFDWPDGLPEWQSIGECDNLGFAAISDVDDTVFIHRAVGRDADCLNDHRWELLEDDLREVPSGLSTRETYLGDWRCYAAIVQSETECNSAIDTLTNSADTTASRSGLQGKSSASWSTTTIANNMWLYHRDLDTGAVALLYLEEAENDGRAESLVNRTLPLIAVFQLKVQWIFESNYMNNYREPLMQSRQQLDRVVCRSYTAAQELDAIDAQSHDIAVHLEKLIRLFGQFSLAQETVALTYSKYKECLESSQIEGGGYFRLIDAEMRHAVEQMAADEGYIRATMDSAKAMLTALGTRAAVERARIEQEENRLQERRNDLLNLGAYIVGISGLALAFATDDFVTAALRGANMLSDDGMATFEQLLAGKLVATVLAGVLTVAIIQACRSLTFSTPDK